MTKIVFYCHVNSKLLQTVEFYKQDLDALKSLGYEVIIATRLREIPFRFDYLFIWWWTHAAIPVFISRMLRRPSIVTGTFNFRAPGHFKVEDYFTRPAWQRILIRYAVKKANMNIFVNRLEEENCKDYFQLDTARYCPHVVHEDYLRGPGPERETSIFNISWSGKANLKRKGIPELIGAVAILKKRGIKVKAYLAGHQGDGYSWLKQLVSENDLADQVNILGEITREEKINKFRRCELYIQPSHYEGFGLAQAEAMGCGASVITCRVGAVEEVVGDAGVYVEPGNVDALANAIEKMIANPKMRREYQERAVKRIRTLFSPKEKLRIFERLFEELESRDR